MSEKLEELISLLYQDRLTQYGKRLLVENIEKLQKENEEKDIVIDLMTERTCLTVEEMRYIDKRIELIGHFNLYREIKRIFYNKARGIKNEI